MVGKIHVVLRNVGAHENLVVPPEGNAAEDGGQIPQHGVGVLLALDEHVAGKTWFCASCSVGHCSVTVLGDAVQLPFVDHGCVYAVAHAVNFIEHQVVKNPRGVIAVGDFEITRPRAAVGSGHRIIGGWYADQFTLWLAGGFRHAAVKLAGVELDIKQRGIRIAQLTVDDLSKRKHLEGVNQLG